VNHFLTDPVVLICSGIIVVGLIGLFWAIGKFSRLESAPRVEQPMDDFSRAMTNRMGLDFTPPSKPLSSPVVPAVPGVTEEMANRLESMTQRLAEMQAVLAKQSSDAGAAPGAVGQGFSPETIDKLIKIVGNVIQQVDILQKSLNLSKENSPAAAESPAAKL